MCSEELVAHLCTDDQHKILDQQLSKPAEKECTEAENRFKVAEPVGATLRKKRFKCVKAVIP